MSYRLKQPLDPVGNSFGLSRDGELCTVGGRHFILANIELPYRDNEEFVWTCWVSLSDESFTRIDTRWETASRENGEPAFGWLSSNLRVHQNPVGFRPWVELEPTDHPLALEQRTGISDERIAAVYHAFADDG